MTPCSEYPVQFWPPIPVSFGPATVDRAKAAFTSTINGAPACTGRWNLWEYDMGVGGLTGGTLRGRVTVDGRDTRQERGQAAIAPEGLGNPHRDSCGMGVGDEDAAHQARLPAAFSMLTTCRTTMPTARKNSA